MNSYRHDSPTGTWLAVLGDKYRLLLTNTAPAASSAVKADLTEIAAGNGYTAGGATSAATVSTAAGVGKLALADVTITASGGSIGPFRYAVVYNDTPTSPADPLIGWYDYGAAVTLADGDPLLIDCDATTGVLTIT